MTSIWNWHLLFVTLLFTFLAQCLRFEAFHFLSAECTDWPWYWSLAAAPGCHCGARQKAQGLYLLSSPSAFPHPHHVRRPLSAQLYLDFSSCFRPFQSRSYLCSCVCSPLCPTTSRLRLTCLSTSLPPVLHSRFCLTFFHAIFLSLHTGPVMVTWGPAGPGVSAVLQCIFRPQHFPSAPECLFSHHQLSMSVLLLHCDQVLQPCRSTCLYWPSRWGLLRTPINHFSLPN